MEKRTVWFGIPMYAVRKQLFPYLVVNGILAVYFIGASLNESDYFIDLIIDEPRSALILLVFPVLIAILSVVLLGFRAIAYRKRLKRLGGRVCFVCGYEIGEGLERCSECGAMWSLDDLNKGWRKLAVGKKGTGKE